MCRMKTWNCLKIFIAIFLMMGFAAAYAAYPPATKTPEGWVMPDGEQFIFLSQLNAREKMAGTERDGFLAKITNLDMELRMKEDLEPENFDADMKKFKTFLKDSTLPWMMNEKTAVYESLQQIYYAAKKTAPKFIPDKVYFIKTTGDEEAGDMYVRGECIVIPQRILDDMTGKRDSITGKRSGQGTEYIARRGHAEVSRRDYLTHRIACMMFHVLTARNEILTNRLYGLIGFYPVKAVDVEGRFKTKIITDPTCWNTDYVAAVVDDQGKRTFISPVCYSVVSTYNKSYGESLSNYRRLKFVEVGRGGKLGSFKMKTDQNGEAQITVPSLYPNFYDMIRNNSQNLDHPADIMADNAALAILLQDWEKKYKGFGSNLDLKMLDKVRNILSGGM
ncbi:MAG: hypothetical protein M1269_00610 [Chloroflexi bacterium]|nr:hypothetical protein [Chloroflexota bacterium]